MPRLPDRHLAGRLLAEGVVVVGSILVAFALDAWWANRAERRPGPFPPHTG